MIDTIKKNNALKLYLKTGEIVICDFRGFIVPEMVKLRPVVVISKSSTHWRELCTTVPFSTSAPTKIELWHVRISNPLRGYLPPNHDFGIPDTVWVKCDMIYTVSFGRITRPHYRLDGWRHYGALKMGQDDLDAVFNGVRSYLPSQR